MFSNWNIVSSFGSQLSFIAFCIFIANVYVSLKNTQEEKKEETGNAAEVKSNV